MRCQRLPSPPTDISISAWPSIRPAMPLSACRLASSSRSRVRNRRDSTTNSATISGAPMKSGSANCQPKNTSMMMASSTTRLVEAISNAIAAVKWAPLAEQRAGNRDRRIGARRRGCPQRERGRNGTRPVVGQQAAHFPMRNHRLHYRRQCEAENERPQDFPSHGERHAEGAQDGINHRKPPLKLSTQSPCPQGCEPSWNLLSSRARQNYRARYDQGHAGGAAEPVAERQQLLTCDIEGDAGNPDEVHDTADEQQRHQEPATAEAVAAVPKPHA